MKKTDSQKLDQIISMMGDVVDVFGKRFDKIDGRFDKIETRLTSIEHEITAIDKRLDGLEEHYGNLKGVTKEIDDLRARMTAIESTSASTKKSPPDL